MFPSTRDVARPLLLTFAGVMVSASPGLLEAQTVVPQSALTPSGKLYTDLIGGGIGNIVVMTDGGHAPGIGNPTGRNDDGFSGPINFGYTFNFFGSNYNQFFANNNGNISFGGGISDYVPTGPTGANEPVISPWFGDVDTEGALSGVLHIRQDIANETILTWDHVGYYDLHDNALNTFQLVIRGSGFATPTGEGSIGFFYQDMGWEVTNTSTTAAVGFGNGAGQSEVLQGSNTSGLNTVVANHYIWFDQNLAPIPPTPPVTSTPEPGTYALMLTGLGAVGVVTRRRKTRAHQA